MAQSENSQDLDHPTLNNPISYVPGRHITKHWCYFEYQLYGTGFVYNTNYKGVVLFAIPTVRDWDCSIYALGKTECCPSLSQTLRGRLEP